MTTFPRILPAAILILALSAPAVLAADTAQEIDRRIAVAVDELNRDLERANNELRAGPAQPNPYGARAEIDQSFAEPVARVNRELDLAAREIRNRWDHQRLQQSLSMHVAGSPEYNRIQGELNQLDNNLAQINREVSDIPMSVQAASSPAPQSQMQVQNRPAAVTMPATLNQNGVQRNTMPVSNTTPAAPLPSTASAPQSATVPASSIAATNFPRDVVETRNVTTTGPGLDVPSADSMNIPSLNDSDFGRTVDTLRNSTVNNPTTWSTGNNAGTVTTPSSRMNSAATDDMRTND